MNKGRFVIGSRRALTVRAEKQRKITLEESRDARFEKNRDRLVRMELDKIAYRRRQQTQQQEGG